MQKKFLEVDINIYEAFLNRHQVGGILHQFVKGKQLADLFDTYPMIIFKFRNI